MVVWDNRSMSYSIGTHITFKKKEATQLFKASTEFAIGTRVLFINWLSPIATLDLTAI